MRRTLYQAPKGVATAAGPLTFGSALVNWLSFRCRHLATVLAATLSLTGLFGAAVHAAGPTAVTITATGTITSDIGPYPGLVGKTFTVYFSYPAALLQNNCNFATYCSATTSATMILEISGEPEVISDDYGGNYRISLGPPDSLIADAGSFTDVYER